MKNFILYKIFTKIIGWILLILAIVPASIMLFLIGLYSTGTLGESLTALGKIIGHPIKKTK